MSIPVLQYGKPSRSLAEFSFLRDFKSKDGNLGKGSFASVKLVKEKRTGNILALKMVDVNLKQATKSDLHNLQVEIENHEHLNHPNIIKFYDHIQENERVYMVLEYAPHGNLYTHIHKKKILPADQIFRFFYQTCLAVQYLHEKDIIHRDIKPENLLLDKDMNIKLCDFGWSAKSILQKRTTFCGTYEYMAPEIVDSKTYNYTVDIWSLGILLFELLHGQPPYKGRNLVDIKFSLSRNDIKFSPSVDPAAKDLIYRILRAEPEKRLSIREILGHDWVRSNLYKPPSINDLEKPSTSSKYIDYQANSQYPQSSLLNLYQAASDVKTNLKGWNTKEQTQPLGSRTNFDEISTNVSPYSSKNYPKVRDDLAFRKDTQTPVHFDSNKKQSLQENVERYHQIPGLLKHNSENATVEPRTQPQQYSLDKRVAMALSERSVKTMNAKADPINLIDSALQKSQLNRNADASPVFIKNKPYSYQKALDLIKKAQSCRSSMSDQLKDVQRNLISDQIINGGVALTNLNFSTPMTRDEPPYHAKLEKVVARSETMIPDLDTDNLKLRGRNLSDPSYFTSKTHLKMEFIKNDPRRLNPADLATYASQTSFEAPNQIGASYVGDIAMSSMYLQSLKNDALNEYGIYSRDKYLGNQRQKSILSLNNLGSQTPLSIL